MGMVENVELPTLDGFSTLPREHMPNGYSKYLRRVQFYIAVVCGFKSYFLRGDHEKTKE